MNQKEAVSYKRNFIRTLELRKQVSLGTRPKIVDEPPPLPQGKRLSGTDLRNRNKKKGLVARAKEALGI